METAVTVGSHAHPRRSGAVEPCRHGPRLSGGAVTALSGGDRPGGIDLAGSA